MKTALASIFALALSVAPSSASASTLRVPQDFPTAYAAVTASHAGDVVLLAAGQYEDFGVNVYDRTGLTIRGVRRDDVVLLGAKSFLQYRVFSIDGCSDIAIENLTIQGDSDISISVWDSRNVSVSNVRVIGGDAKNPGPIQFRNSENVRLSRVDVSKLPYAAVSLGSENYEVFGKVEVSRCRFTDIPGNALVLHSHDATVERCRFERVAQSAILVNPGIYPGDAVLRDNRFIDVAGDAVLVDGNQFVRIEGNEWVRPVGFGLFVSHALGSIVRGNRLTDPQSAGLMDFTSGARLEKNRIIRPKNVAIVIGLADAVVARNRVEDAAAIALQTFGGRTTFEKNRVDGGAGIGIRVEVDCNEARLLDNRVSNTTGNGIDVAGANCVLDGNRVSGCGNIGFEIPTSGNQLMRNVSRGSTVSDLHCDLETNDVTKSNRFGTVQDIP